MADISNDSCTLKYKRCMQCSILHEIAATETVCNRIQATKNTEWVFFSLEIWFQFGWNTNHLKLLLSLSFNTPKRALTECQWLFLGQTHIFTRAKEQYWHVDRQPVDIRVSSESPWEKKGQLGHSIHQKFQIYSVFWPIYHQILE